MERSYKPLFIAALITGAVAIYILAHTGTVLAPQPAQLPTHKFEMRIVENPSLDELETLKDNYTSQIEGLVSGYYPIPLDYPLRVKRECLERDLNDFKEGVGRGVETATLFNGNLLNQLVIYYKEYWKKHEEGSLEKHKDKLMKIIENCFPKPQ